jgi:hypothetical protein
VSLAAKNPEQKQQSALVSEQARHEPISSPAPPCHRHPTPTPSPWTSRILMHVFVRCWQLERASLQPFPKTPSRRWAPRLLQTLTTGLLRFAMLRALPSALWSRWVMGSCR